MHKKLLFVISIVFLAVFAVIFAKAATSVKTETKTTILKDSDGDGLLDADDPHPDIPEIYIVEDKNLNGIVDKFENEKQ